MLFDHYLQSFAVTRRTLSRTTWARGAALGLGLMGAHLVHAALTTQDTIKQAIQAGQLDQALKLVQQERQAHPQEVQFQFMEGVVLAQQGQTDKAIETFKKITDSHPDLSEAYNNLGVLYAAKGRLEESRSYLEKALQTHPSYAAAHRNLSDVHSQLAKQSYAKALQVDPKAKISAPQLTLLGSIGRDKQSATPLTSSPASPMAETPKSAVPSAVAPTPSTAPVAPVAPAVVASAPAQALPAAKSAPAVAAAAAPTAPVAQVTPQVVKAPEPKAPQAKPTEAKQAAPATTPSPTKQPAAATHEASKAAAATPKVQAPAKTDEADVRAAVQAWAKAWSQKDMPHYLAAYSSTFAGADRQSRTKWESDRQVRILSKKSIAVAVNNLKIEVNGTKATAQFQQVYESDNFKGNSRKTLEMVKHGDRWLIARETVN
ncbi:hypothetical protein B9Z51_13295 [Limnohabitans sp. T6-5]|nr:hypothetical protein B9Z51_13295 [Limnohabitans sp. T6-5]